MTSRKSNLTKVRIDLPAEAWHGQGAEYVWAEAVGDDAYRLRSVPFYAYAISLEDVFRAASDDEGQLVLEDVFLRGGHSTYRIFLQAGLSDQTKEFLAAWRPLEGLGCSYEGATDRYLAVDVPATVDVYLVYAALEAGEENGVWDFEEGHCGHPVVHD